MAEENKVFFLKRWIDTLSRWLDGKLFSLDSEEAGSVGIPLFWSLIVSFVLGLTVCIRSFFKGDATTFNNVVGVIALVAVVALIVFFLIKDLPAFDSVGKKIGRTVYVVVLCGIVAAIGFYLAVLAMYIIMAAIGLWVLFQVVLGGSSESRKKNRIKLENGEELDVERGMLGEKYYTDSSGREYEETSSGSFRMKE
jgi:hypothetical protein